MPGREASSDWKAAIGVRRRLNRNTNPSTWDGRCFALTPWWVPFSQVSRFEKVRWTRGSGTDAFLGSPTVAGRWS